jgi:NodT family efflux transporter outer membrane factor (OMF) lipoprotein
MALFSGRGSMRAAVVFAASTLAACTTLGPDYQEPEVAWLDDWRTTLYGQVGEPGQQSQFDLRFWWRAFDDPALDQLIASARASNPSLRIAGLRILESRAQLGIAGSTLHPQVQQVVGAIDYVNTTQRGGGLPGRSQDFASYQAGFNIAWELDFWGRFRRGIESADAAFFASVANQRDAQVLLTAQVADFYYAYRTTQLRIDIAEKNAAIQKRSYEITERIYRSGQDSELDLQQARTQYLATLSTIPELQIGLVQIRNALCTLLGRPPGHLPELAGEVDQLPAVDIAHVSGIPARLLIRRPDVRAAAWQVATQSAQIGVAEADFYPSISLSGTVGWSGTTLGGSPDTGTLAVGPGVVWNIFDYGRIANNVRVQDARLQQLIEQYQLTVLQAAQEIDNAAISVVKYAEQHKVLSDAVSAADRALELANTQYREGYAGFQRVLDAQRAAFSQAERELVNRGNNISAIVALYKGLGGGWLDMTPEQMIPAKTRNAMQERTDWGNLLDEPLPASAPETPSATGSSKNE